jgi:hypothetical protein
MGNHSGNSESIKQQGIKKSKQKSTGKGKGSWRKWSEKNGYVMNTLGKQLFATLIFFTVE